MNKILFATHNESKLNLYKNMLKNDNYNLICLNEISIDYVVEEIGSNSKEIAIKKVKEYSRLANYITISEDTGLYFEGVDDNEQPGVNVNTYNGVKLSEEERIEHYLKLINKYGGKLNGYWLKTIAISDLNSNIYTYDYKVHKVFINKVDAKRNSGYPLDSISITPEYDKYTVELTDEENTKLNEKCNKEIHDFIIKTLDAICKR
jgi:XTP/dITP diphosphohydrolase